MSNIPIEIAQAELPSTIDKLKPGESVLIIKGNEPVARLSAELKPTRQPRKPGSAVGLIQIIQEDDDHSKVFAEYMP